MVAETSGWVVVNPEVGGGSFACLAARALASAGAWLQKSQWSFVSLKVVGVESFLANGGDDRLEDF